jgi:hypothetical protein
MGKLMLAKGVVSPRHDAALRLGPLLGGRSATDGFLD